MSRNVEIKAHLNNASEVRKLAASIADEGPIEISQDDTFFRCESGRLKLRRFSNDAGELIYYERVDEDGPKESFYLRSPISNSDVLLKTLSLAYGTAGRVRKQRTLFLVGRTRIHIDCVEGLGDYLELEVMLGDDEESDAGFNEARELMGRLGIRDSDLVKGAYVDLLDEDAS